MPVYEFVCRACNKIYSFHSFVADTDKVPSCPKCGAKDLTRVPSRFGVKAPRKTSAGEHGDGDGGGVDEARMEREMMRLAAELEGMDENDPRQMAKAVRRMTELAGEPVTPTMEEMIRRLEAGEDPEKLEEELGDALEEEMEGSGAFGGAPPTHDDGLYPM
jgi:putative FmdB family regulatory protein